MSDPTIWDIAMGGNPPEKFVPYADYAQLMAEVERLRKAGDAMQKSMLECGPNEMAEAFHYDDWWVSYYGWNAAKEGKPSV